MTTLAVGLLPETMGWGRPRRQTKMRATPCSLFAARHAMKIKGTCKAW